MRLNLFQKFIYCLFAFAGFPFVILSFIYGFINLSSQRQIALLNTLIPISYAFFVIIIFVSGIIWHVIDVKKRTSEFPIDNKRIIGYCILQCRYLFATIIIFYGFQKLLLDQLHAGYYWYGDELGKLSGMQLTWAFFGYSKIYSSVIAFAQIIGGSLLLFGRTTLLGALFLLPVLINITLIDYNYDISAKDIITVLLLMDIFLISISFKPLLSFFLYQKTVDGKLVTEGYSIKITRYKLFKTFAVAGVLIFSILPNYLQMKPIHPTPFEGAWDAISAQNFTDTIPEKNKKLTLRMFIDGITATVKKTYQYEDFTLKYDSSKSFITLISTSDTLHPNTITGNYKLLHKDSLIFSGKDGPDSVHWVFKRTSK